MEAKRHEILEKVGEMYHQYGIRSVTMNDVVHEMGISKKTLYQYFSDKNELVKAVMDAVFEKRHAEMLSLIAGRENAIDEMLGYYALQNKMIRDHKPTVMYDLRKYYPEIFEKVTERKRKHLYNSVLQNLTRGKTEGLYREDLNEDIIARLNLMRVESIMTSGIFSRDEIVNPAFFREVFLFHMYGIINDQGKEFLNKNIDKLK